MPIDSICHEYITVRQDAIPAPLNYRGFPKSICTSINHVVCHGIPSGKILKMRLRERFIDGPEVRSRGWPGPDGSAPFPRQPSA